MASIEFLQNRVNGKVAEIEKLNKKLERINKAELSGWNDNPYYYNERDKKYTMRDIEQAEKALAEYQSKLDTEIKKANSRNIKVLVDFLENWKVKTIEYFKAEYIRYKAAKEEYYDKDSEYVKRMDEARREYGFNSAEYKAIYKEHREYDARFRRSWTHVTQFNHGSLTWTETMEKDIEQEKNRKYDDIIERVNQIVGTITDASNLSVGAKGDLNGIIIGDEGKAKVTTIGAGGYNIQRFHFRTLVHEAK